MNLLNQLTKLANENGRSEEYDDFKPTHDTIDTIVKSEDQTIPTDGIECTFIANRLQDKEGTICFTLDWYECFFLLCAQVQKDKKEYQLNKKIFTGFDLSARFNVTIISAIKPTSTQQYIYHICVDGKRLISTKEWYIAYDFFCVETELFFKNNSCDSKNFKNRVKVIVTCE